MISVVFSSAVRTRAFLSVDGPESKLITEGFWKNKLSKTVPTKWKDQASQYTKQFVGAALPVEVALYSHALLRRQL